MKTRKDRQIKSEKKTIKDEVLRDFQENMNTAKELGKSYMPTGQLRYYLSDGKYSTYAGRVIDKYCQERGIIVKRIGATTLDRNWEGEEIHKNMRVFIWN